MLGILLKLAETEIIDQKQAPNRNRSIEGIYQSCNTTRHPNMDHRIDRQA
jgi:hypothetical protein